MLNTTLSVNLVCRPKSSFLPSYIIDVRELDEKLLNIIDMKFLHGYYEPTLLILFEPNQTWPGSVHYIMNYRVPTPFLFNQLIIYTLLFFTLSGVWLCVRTRVASSPFLSTSCRKSILSSGPSVICPLTVHRSWLFPNPSVSSVLFCITMNKVHCI